jgi:hypothetical protein
MIWMNKAFKIGIAHGAFLVLDFEFLLVLNHNDVTWDCSKREDLDLFFILKHMFWRMRGAVRTL